MGAFGRLSALTVAKATAPGMYPDGGGLYLQIGHGNARSWVFRYMLEGRSREMGLGSARVVSLADARKKAAEHRLQLSNRIDPLSARQAERTSARVAAASSASFRQVAEAYIEAHEAEWKSNKHASQWRATLAAYAYPIIGNLPVQSVNTDLVLKVLNPIWREKTETAGRVRGRIESIIDSATARGQRQGENPARWRGHLDNLLPKPSKVQKVEHHPALPFNDISSFMENLRCQGGIGAEALEFLILTAARTGEVIGAMTTEIEIPNGIWTVPAGRTKSGREHRVPLSPQALQLLARKGLTAENSALEATLVFPGGKSGRPLSTAAMSSVLKRMERENITVHGFRSTFRDWCDECTDYPNEVAEMALAHVISDQTEAAYRRGDLFEKRRRLMTDWADFCSPRPSSTATTDDEKSRKLPLVQVGP